jgi:hypothetical protein
MPVSEPELAQLRAYLDAMRQLLEAIEARYKVEPEGLDESGAPLARARRIR